MNRAAAYALYGIMIKIRMVEERIIEEYPQQLIRTPVHLCIGQEAVAAGISINLRPQDCIVSNHRSHGHCLARGLDLEAFFKELYGRQGGVCGGRGGSMHLSDLGRGIVGASAIVAGGIPIGAGMALGQKIKQQSALTVIYFGDGAVDEGIFWETLNFCALQSLPVLFVLEDNGYAAQTPTGQRHSYGDITCNVQSFGVPALLLDGNDAIEVARIGGDFFDQIRSGGGPRFLCCQTYRWMGHVGYTDDADVGYRPAEELASWRARCPVLRLEDDLIEDDPGEAPGVLFSLRRHWAEEIARAVDLAKEAAYAVD